MRVQRPSSKIQSRREFVRLGALFVPTIFIPRLIRAQTILTADGLGAFGTNAPAAGGGSSTSYANTGGTGSRASIITVGGNALSGPPSLLVDGSTTGTGVFITGTTLNGSQNILFDFLSGHTAVIDEAKFYQQTAATQGTWQWNWSNDNSTYTTIGGSFAFGGVTTQTITALSGNTQAARYYKLIGLSGATSPGPWAFEFEFKLTYT